MKCDTEPEKVRLQKRECARSAESAHKNAGVCSAFPLDGRRSQRHRAFAYPRSPLLGPAPPPEGRQAPANLRTTSVSFCPPKPKLFERQMSTFAGRAVLGT